MKKLNVNTINGLASLNNSEIEVNWSSSLNGDKKAIEMLIFHYVKQLLKIRPLYLDLNEDTFITLLMESVTKSLDRGLKFKVRDYNTYMNIASQTYFKHSLENNTDTLNIPNQLLLSFTKLEEVYIQIPSLNTKDDETQINLLSKGFEYPIFPTRLMYFSYKKWINNSLRQIDVDLTVNLLPTPQRIKWEIFYEKNTDDIISTINNLLQTLKD